MAGATGLEPATSAVTGQRSNQLSYAPAGVGQELKAAPPPSQGNASPPANLRKSPIFAKNRWSNRLRIVYAGKRVWRFARLADLKRRVPLWQRLLAKSATPTTVTLKHLAAALAEAHEMSKKQAEDGSRRPRRQHRQAPEEGRAHPHRRPRHSAGAQARRAHGPQSGDRRSDPDQGEQESRLPRFEGSEGSSLGGESRTLTGRRQVCDPRACRFLL